QVQRPAGVACERELPGDAEALAERGPAAEAELGGDGAEVHLAAACEARLLAVEREQPVRDRAVLERAAHQPGGRDRPAVVGERSRSGVGELAHLGELASVLPDRDRGREAHGHLRLLERPRAQAAQDLGRVDDRVGVRHREDRAVAPGRGRGRARGDRLLVLAAGRAQVDVRVDERGCEHEPGPVDDAVAVRAEPLAELRDGAAVDADVEHGVDPLDRVEDARAADDEVVGAGAPDEDHATSSAASTSAGPAVSRSYSTAIRTASPARTWSTTSAAPESATRGSISTPRFIGPGCITFCPGRSRSGVTHQRAAYSRSEGT